jgi:hypothetical protein
MEFKFEGRAKIVSQVLMGIGVIALIAGFLTDGSDHHQRWWANLLVNGFFWFSLSLAALFFYALNYAVEAAWSAVIKRVFEAMWHFLPIGAGVIVVVLVAGNFFHAHHLYHWMDHTLYHEFMVVGGEETSYVDVMEEGAVANPNYDKIIAHKGAYFANWFFWLRTLMYIGTFMVFSYLFRKWSLLEDESPDLNLHYKQFRRSAVFLVLFAVFSSMLSWDWIMSIDVHWFSTLFGWYLFSGMWVGFMIFLNLALIWLRSKGYYQEVTESHMHDISKWMFAISMLWSYLWVSQFLLIWYANIPEEVTYYTQRFFSDYQIPFMLTFLVNFAVPFYSLLPRDTKRNPNFIVPVGLLIFVGHFADVYLLVIPGTMFDHNEFGIFEVGLFLGFLGLYINRTLSALSKAPLIALNHPMLQESKDLHY